MIHTHVRPEKTQESIAQHRNIKVRLTQEQQKIMASIPNHLPHCIIVNPNCLGIIPSFRPSDSFHVGAEQHNYHLQCAVPTRCRKHLAS